MTRRKRFDSTARVSAVAVFEDELKARSDAYVTHLVHGGKADCGEEFYLDALDMAISALREQETVTDSHQLSGSCKNCTDHTDGCEYCRESENIYYHAGEVNALDELLYITGDDLVVDIGCRFYLAASIKFCPMCGRRLEEV